MRAIREKISLWSCVRQLLPIAQSQIQVDFIIGSRLSCYRCYSPLHLLIAAIHIVDKDDALALDEC